ncbi:MAG: helix-turn-helix transcriptional regulator [Chitinophagales bacterium]|nr:helix-turn-helix transcriptional regulator [Chitinophagales bacterium]
MVKTNKLTVREIEVLEQLREGHSYKEVAAILEINTETVRKHAGNIYTKLEAKNRTQAIKKYFK